MDERVQDWLKTSTAPFSDVKDSERCIAIPMDVFRQLVANGESGLGLRDWFAGQALTGAIASETEDWHHSSPENAAEYAYKLADAMLKARDSSNG